MVCYELKNEEQLRIHKVKDGLITLALFGEIEIERVVIKYGFGIG